ncbi:hypothetical protein HZH68_008658 [Vespula germanica]|uniref:Uncharacterized protein n=1 Tax=Vespula germanica TaxID=30212 RepID=A0A834K1H9_VESGE|nr:hypothetical protein HZH68_008658 [Vespula germanica]
MVPIVATAGTATAIVKAVLVVVIQLGIIHDDGGSSGNDTGGSSGGGGSGGGGGGGGGGGYRKSGGIREGVVNGSREVWPIKVLFIIVRHEWLLRRASFQSN